MASSTAVRQAATRPNRGYEVALAAARTAAENRGRDIVILDLREVTTEFDYFVIATGTSRRQLHAMSEEIDNTLQRQLGDHRLGIEGYEESRWIVLDYGDVVVHLFERDARDYYGIDDLWCRGTRIPYEPAAEPQARQPSPK